jgi:hypothetical protein
LYVNYHNLNVRCIETNIFYNGFCKHGGDVALVWTWPSRSITTLENVVQTPPNGPFDHENLLWEIIIRHTRMQQGLCLVEVAFIPTTRILDFIASEKGKDGGQCHFLCKTHIIHLDNDLQQLRINSAFEFSRFKF